MEEILVSAASSLTDAFNALTMAWTRAEAGAVTARMNFGASGALQQQILAGAPVDVFASASPVEMDRLAKSGRIDLRTRIVFATNRLVLIAPSSSRIKEWSDLTAPTVVRIAISNPASVPSGRYAKETLQKRGSWTALQPKLVLGDNVRQTLAYVATGDVDAGIVFRTDTRSEKRVRIVSEALPGKDHDPIVYPAAVVTGSSHAEAAKRFVGFLKSSEAARILAGFGFGSP